MTAAWIHNDDDIASDFEQHVLSIKPKYRRPPRGFIERIVRAWSARKLRGLRSRIEEINASHDDEAAAYQIMVQDAESERNRIARLLAVSKESVEQLTDENERLEKQLSAAQFRIKELECDVSIARRENELLAAVVERDHRRVEAETAVHFRIADGETVDKAAGMIKGAE